MGLLYKHTTDVNYTPARIRCEHCHLVVAVPKLDHKQRAHCPRCNHRLTQFHHYTSQRLVALAISGILLLLFALPFEFIEMRSSGMEHSINIVEGIISLEQRGYLAMSLGVLLTIIVIPLSILCCVIYLLFPLMLGKSVDHPHVAIKVLYALLPWSMAEVFLLGVLVSVIKLSDTMDIYFGPAFYIFAAFIACLILVTIYLDRFHLLKVHGLPAYATKIAAYSLSIQRTWALLLTSALLYIPANTLPIMETTQLGDVQQNSIISGVIELWQSGSYPVAIIIFLASVLIPVIKISVLAWLNFTLQQRAPSSQQERISWFRLVDFIGRWSMVDIFVVAILASLLQFGNTLSVVPGPAIIAFAGVVLLTMIAAVTFDTRLIWRQKK